MRSIYLIAGILFIGSHIAAAQSPEALDVPATAHASAPATDATTGANQEGWELSLSVYAYFVPDDHDYVQPTFTADRDWLHLEARYNYEDLDTASAWVGYNFSFGDEVTLDFTAMVGGVFGDTDGVAPGYELTLGWRGLELYSEAEYVIDVDDTSDSFFYTWSELTYSPLEWLRAGIVVQRTKAYETDFDIQRGLLVGATYRNLDFAVYVFNPDDDPTVVFGVTYEF